MQHSSTRAILQLSNATIEDLLAKHCKNLPFVLPAQQKLYKINTVFGFKKRQLLYKVL